MIFIDLYCANINPEKEIFICVLHKFYLQILFKKLCSILILKILNTMTNYSLKSYLQIFFCKNNNNSELAGKGLLKQMSFKSLF